MALLSTVFGHWSLCGFLMLILGFPTAWADVPYNEPFQIVRPSVNHTSMVLVDSGVANLAQHPSEIALVSVVGPYHSGKSFLLNALLRRSQVFSVGSQTAPETMGIWLCRTFWKTNDGAEIWLMDSEGFFGPGVEESYDAKMFAVASLVGSHVVYNSVKVIDQQAVNMLEMLVQRAQLFRTRTSNSQLSGTWSSQFLHDDRFPPLTWVIEDFVQALPSAFREEGATGWLRTYLENSRVVDASPGSMERCAGDLEHCTWPQHQDHQSSFLLQVYPDIRVHTLFLPATGREELRDLSRVPFDQLTAEFRSEVEELRKHILRSLNAQGPFTVVGSTVANKLRFLVRGVQEGKFHELSSLWKAWTDQVSAISLNDAAGWFSTLLQDIDIAERPAALQLYNDRLNEARENATRFYNALLKDFSSKPQIGLLQKLMNERAAVSVMAYHERVRKWVHESIGKYKANFSRLLSSFTLPQDPLVLLQNCSKFSDELRERFAREFMAFSRVDDAKTYVDPVKLPIFAPDPVTQLASDLTALLGARNMDNERQVQQLFKLTIAFVDAALVRELSAHDGALLNKVRMAQVRKVAEELVWQEYDNQLNVHAWMREVAHYRSTRALIKSDHLEEKLSKFERDNERRLAAYFSNVLDRVLATYTSNITNIQLPVAETEVETQHAHVMLSVGQQLTKEAKDLSDTNEFQKTKQSLDYLTNDKLLELKVKNINQWKAQCDEATRCGSQREREARITCGKICLFNTIPLYHKYIMKIKLMECFKDSWIGSGMSDQLKNSVFESWYYEDLSPHVQEVSRNLGMLVILLVIVLLACSWICWVCRGGASPLYGISASRASYQGPGGYSAVHRDMCGAPFRPFDRFGGFSVLRGGA